MLDHPISIRVKKKRTYILFIAELNYIAVLIMYLCYDSNDLYFKTQNKRL